MNRDEINVELQLATRRRYPDMFTRLIANTRIPEGQSETTGCWEWTGKVNNANYGQVTKYDSAKGRAVNVYAHRQMEIETRGQYNEFDLDDDPLGPILLIPRPALDVDEETIDHLCCFRRCANPDHWNIETRVQNSKLCRSRLKGK